MTDLFPPITNSLFEESIDEFPREKLWEHCRMWGKHFPTFLQGLYDNMITFKMFHEDMMYFGGNQPSSEYKDIHDKYYLKMGGNPDNRPPSKDRCICRVPIVQQCYAVYKDDTHGIKKTRLVIGNCCVERYITLENRTKQCFNCDTLHYQLDSNLCDSCRKTCSECGETKRNVVEGGMCKKCRNIMEEENERKKLIEYNRKREEQNRVERHRLAEIETEIRAKRAREFQEAERIRLEKERVIREKQREIDEADRATQLYLQKAQNQRKCECGKPITGTYPKCKTCFSKSKTCSMVGCNKKIMNPKYDRCYVCNKS